MHQEETPIIFGIRFQCMILDCLRFLRYIQYHVVIASATNVIEFIIEVETE